MGLLRGLVLIGCGVTLGVALVVASFVTQRDVLELLDATQQTSSTGLQAAMTGAKERATERAKARAADAVTDVAHSVVDAVAERLKEETDRAAEDAKRSFASEAREALGVGVADAGQSAVPRGP
jgi:predicted metalloprotease